MSSASVMLVKNVQSNSSWEFVKPAAMRVLVFFCEGSMVPVADSLSAYSEESSETAYLFLHQRRTRFR